MSEGCTPPASCIERVSQCGEGGHGGGHGGIMSAQVCAVFSCLVVSDSLRPHELQPARLLCPWDSPGKNTGVGCHALLQGIFPIQGLNLGLLHCRQIL